MKHTQGKWEVTGQSENSRYITVKADSGRTVARVPWNSEKENGQGIYTDFNDAKLIAKAPVMLKTLREICDSVWSLDEIQADALTHKELYKILRDTGMVAEKVVREVEGW